MIHTERNAYAAIQSEMKSGLSLLTYFKIFRKHLKIAIKGGHSTADVIDALRPITQELWMGMSTTDKKQFIRHLSSLWNIARHRVSPQAHLKMQELINKGKLELLSGNLLNIEEHDCNVVITIKERKTDQIKKLNVDRVINCTGPQSDIEKIDHPLLQSLLAKGLITPNELKIGIHATISCKAIDSNNKVSNQLYVIGSLLRGLFWESSAVPELRKQAESICKSILQELHDEFYSIENDTLKI